jgi:2-keto-4-pentenoate hydratase
MSGLSTEAPQLAELLAAARRERRFAQPLPAALVPQDRLAAYRIADEVIRKLGWETGGWKVAATNADMQRRLRSPEPIYGRVFRKFISDSPASLPLASLLTPLVECEFALVMGRSLPPRSTPYSREEVADAVAAVHPAIEVAECRFHDADLPPIEGVLADGSASGRLVLGSECRDWRKLDLAALPVKLYTDGRLRREGVGADAMGHPLNVLHWLANARADFRDGLQAGDVISTGTCTKMIPPRAGETHVGNFGVLGSVEVRFTQPA